jgi:Ca2+-binding RTX toxin-like protein
LTVLILAGPISSLLRRKGKAYGGSGDDELYGDRGYVEVYGGGGDDQINAGGGVDTSEGGAGDDSINAGDGNETSKGGDGNDTYSFSVADWGRDTVKDTAIPDEDPGTGNAVAIGDCFCVPAIPLTPVTIDLASKPGSPEVKNAAGTSTANWSGNIIDNVIAWNSANDTIIGNDAANHIFSDTPVHASRHDQDTVSAGGGDDVDDIGGDGVGDVVDCGDGSDTVHHDTGDTVTNCENEIIVP